VTDNTEKINTALDFALHYGQIDGDRHKAWVIDQMVRALTGCQVVELHALDANGVPYYYPSQGKSDEYLRFIDDHNYGEDGPNTYEWDEGIAP
jgi:hypothetical protein